ncbi:MAG: hypothetical protein PVH58_09005, partial [Desulfobacterales bacterium]
YCLFPNPPYDFLNSSQYLNFARKLTGNAIACVSVGSPKRSLLEKIQVIKSFLFGIPVYPNYSGKTILRFSGSASCL